MPQEDLLDLMVRIAESPEEWERVHRVLSQLGAEKDFYYPSNKEVYPKIGVEKHLMLNSAGEKPLQNVSQNELEFRSNGNNMEYVTLAPNEVLSSSAEVKEAPNLKMDDTGWPNFEDIFIGLRKHHKNFINNDIPETDSVAGHILTAKKSQHHTSLRSKNGSVIKPNEANDPERNIESFLSLRKNLRLPATEKKTTESRIPVMPINIGVSNFPEQKEYSFVKPQFSESSIPLGRFLTYYQKELLTNSTPSGSALSKKNITLEVKEEFLPDRSAYQQSKNRSSRPEFHYHRVTSSPRRNGAGAFIAVSVAKHKSSQAETTGNVPGHNLEDQLTSSVQKKRKHKRKTNHHHHGKGRHRRQHQTPH